MGKMTLRLIPGERQPDWLRLSDAQVEEIVAGMPDFYATTLVEILGRILGKS